MSALEVLCVFLAGTSTGMVFEKQIGNKNIAKLVQFGSLGIAITIWFFTRG